MRSPEKQAVQFHTRPIVMRTIPDAAGGNPPSNGRAFVYQPRLSRRKLRPGTGGGKVRPSDEGRARYRFLFHYRWDAVLDEITKVRWCEYRPGIAFPNRLP